MDKKHTAFLAVICVFLLSVAAISKAQTMDAHRALSAKQRSIIPIAAFTANGDMEKLRTALHEGLDAGLTVNEIKEGSIRVPGSYVSKRSSSAPNNALPRRLTL
jgi:4-carboxymuconolactone decarboxylase